MCYNRTISVSEHLIFTRWHLETVSKVIACVCHLIEVVRTLVSESRHGLLVQSRVLRVLYFAEFGVDLVSELSVSLLVGDELQLLVEVASQHATTLG